MNRNVFNNRTSPPTHPLTNLTFDKVILINLSKSSTTQQRYGSLQLEQLLRSMAKQFFLLRQLFMTDVHFDSSLSSGCVYVSTQREEMKKVLKCRRQKRELWNCSSTFVVGFKDYNHCLIITPGLEIILTLACVIVALFCSGPTEDHWDEGMKTTRNDVSSREIWAWRWKINF